ncbi:GNAT family N-acetyltransferase [Mammaliicoccus lentus]|uniref:GNAT family N-acetyltransferase n=1 Tax=Mammaliicoccus lentus TaxID=42858 RepID=UPI003CE6A31F
MIEFKKIRDESTLYEISQMAAAYFKREDQSTKVAESLEFEAIKRSLAYEESVVFGALDNQKCIGFIWAKFDNKDNEVKVYNLFVSESYRNNKIAAKLKKKLETWAIDKGASSIVSTVHAQNKSMLHINESMGYETEKYIMRKNLF